MKLGLRAKSVKEMTLEVAARMDSKMESLYQQYPELRPSAETSAKSVGTWDESEFGGEPNKAMSENAAKLASPKL